MSTRPFEPGATQKSVGLLGREANPPPADHRLPIASETSSLVRQILMQFRRDGMTLGVAESVTGGLVMAGITATAGASDVFTGGFVTYSDEAKVSLLGIDRRLLIQFGAVHPRVAVEMARGARSALSVTVAVATTGEAGPTSATGSAVGTVHIARVDETGEISHSLQLAGTRREIQEAAVLATLDLVLRAPLTT
jgi:nicotinamide-nucleotide amidase